MEKAHPQADLEVELVRRVKAGDCQAFGEVVSLFQRRVFSMLYRLVRSSEDVEDLAQEVFFKVYRSFDSYDAKSPLENWIGRITVNHAYDYLRRQRARNFPSRWPSLDEVNREVEEYVTGWSESRPNAEGSLVLKDLAGKLLERVPKKDRILLTLKEVEGFSVEEIGNFLDLKPATVKVQLLRARRRMAECYRRLTEAEEKKRKKRDRRALS